MSLAEDTSVVLSNVLTIAAERRRGQRQREIVIGSNVGSASGFGHPHGVMTAFFLLQLQASIIF
jgi:hypothetical protein